MTQSTNITLGGGPTSLDELRDAARGSVRISLGDEARAELRASRQAVEDLCMADAPAYGINTGFGKLAQKIIPRENLDQLQRNLVLSHSCGVGSLLDDDTVRLIMVLKIISLARGYSGVRQETVDLIIELINNDLYPCIPSRGSVGASGDLAPLAHLAAALIGEGTVRMAGRIVPAKEALESIGAEPLELSAKEGLALINGTQVSTALALVNLFEGEKVFAAAMVTGSMSVDAMKGSDAPFDARIHELRGHPGQIATAGVFRKLMIGSEIRESHIDCEKVQDPYSLRCQPQVMGAILDSMRHVARVLVIEANAVTDNPLIFADTGEALSGGNFHAEPVALVADQLAVALSEVGALSERRISNLVDPNLSLLAPFLVPDAGLNSGFMVAQVTAAALASENKTLAHPASVDSLPTSANQEDHVSMATFAARRVGDIAANVAGIVAIELLAAAQAIELHRPQQTSAALEEVISLLRKTVPFYDADRFMAPDIEEARKLVTNGSFVACCDEILPSHA